MSGKTRENTTGEAHRITITLPMGEDEYGETVRQARLLVSSETTNERINEYLASQFPDKAVVNTMIAEFQGIEVDDLIGSTNYSVYLEEFLRYRLYQTVQFLSDTAHLFTRKGAWVFVVRRLPQLVPYVAWYKRFAADDF